MSFKIFLNKYNKNKLSFNIKESIDNIIRKSYFGGRCEVYGNAKINEYVHYYDFSGMYGQCMMEKFPYGKDKLLLNPIDFSIPGFYYIEYYSDMYIPVLPHKSLINDKLMFFNGYNKGIF
jgi:hypothetical protein